MDSKLSLLLVRKKNERPAVTDHLIYWRALLVYDLSFERAQLLQIPLDRCSRCVRHVQFCDAVLAHHGGQSVRIGERNERVSHVLVSD